MEMLAGYISVENEKCQQQNGAVCVCVLVCVPCHERHAIFGSFCIKTLTTSENPNFFSGKT